MEFRRARSEEQKNIRVNQIIDAVCELYAEMPYEAITLTAITGKLDFSRANLYKYFKTKEEIFLVIIERDVKAWADNLREALSSHKSIDIQEFSELWAAQLFANKRLLALISILNTVIEKNVSVDALAAWKKTMFDNFSKLSERMLQIIPNITKEQCFPFFNFQMHYAMGLYPATQPNEVQTEALLQSGIPYQAEAFVPSFARFLSIVLRGLVSAATMNPKGYSDA